MKNTRQFYRCPSCGNIIEVTVNGGGPLNCCGSPMEELTANTTDAAQEKHVPSVKREGNRLTVVIGEVPHPMTEEHHISWIAVAQGSRTSRVDLPHTKEAKAVFTIEEDGPITVYEYCNLHGLWAIDL
ncbi:rubredoxin oxidoreductase [Clostridia bacterium]|nr:rubredoxin oxidoreductase [Clostridia bacterium]